MKLKLAGILFLVIMSAFVVGTVAVYDKAFVDSVPVTLKADRVGNQLRPGGEVKARGVVVGEIRAVHSSGSGASIDLALEPGKVDMLPRDVSALLIPKTLFGERYVQLSIPDGSTAAHLRSGDVIGQDRSANAIELEKVFDNLLPVLQAVQPQKLATTLNTVATALQGRGEQLGQTIASASAYLKDFNPSLPKLEDDLRDLAKVSHLYGDIAPDLLDALTDSAKTLGTVHEKRDALAGLYPVVTTSAQDLTTFLRNNKDNLIGLAATSRTPLEIAAEYSPSFPCTLKALTDLKPLMDKALGKDSDEPGLHVDITVTESRGKYVPGKDDPVYTASGGPRCYPSGVVPSQGTAAAPPGSEAHPLMPGQDDLGVPNSPQERELLASLVAPQLGVPTGQVPDWSSVLVGPLYRGTEVNLK
ncbi:phospholipid/cholesterol/gamma-HCH transport system substrate-binding protein [Amycolatopsis xylanica]|uniref:Phospholipid/cholesterol/gamma-HCH transport system substrate-binding protein n=1 Tax=Amycolatopsis xylanica TaxID=589385 RepID=A0A1H3CHL4_9PSEU|nr:MCE family protein [Amycolatopsis xylanica]SDX53398.1 phospholipid/cholesterol/gamma-HCH transport system substrate-binding protein [Amycolatopsis xylanica]